jgi:hypothetical protein
MDLTTVPPVIEEKPQRRRVSFSQYSMWLGCKHRWYLEYVKKLRKFEGSINTALGISMHETFQEYLRLLYDFGLVQADEFDYMAFFKEAYEREVQKLRDDGAEITEDDYMDFFYNGDDILREFMKTSTRIKHFPSTYELIGIEVPLEIDVMNNLQFVGYLDVVLKEKGTNNYLIIDFKVTSTGWNRYMKEDETKYSQLQIYKKVYSKVLGVPMSNIKIEFFIVKRKFYENVDFKQSRIQIFSPPSGPTAVNETVDSFIEFLEHGFTKDGEFNLDSEYPKYPGKNKKNCRYCKHYKTELCDGKETK